MERLPDTSVEDLRQALHSAAGKTPAKRLIAAIAYKHGVTQSELATWFDVERKTIYNWLTRLENRDLDSAIRNEPRAGRPRKLSTAQLDELHAVLQDPPKTAGIDAPGWTTDLVKRLIRERFGTDYSRSSCRRLMKEAGLSCQTPRNVVVEAVPEDREAVEQQLGKLGHVWLPR